MAKLSGKTLTGSFLFSAFVLLGQTGEAQNTIFPEVDGSIVYNEKVLSDSTDQITLWENALDYLGSLKLIDQVKDQEVYISHDNLIATARQEFYLFKKGIVTKQVEGVLESAVTIKIIPGGYKYRIDSILYQQYSRNRYGKYSPKSSKKYSLESIYAKKTSSDWQKHFVEINSKMEEMQLNIKQKMEK